MKRTRIQEEEIMRAEMINTCGVTIRNRLVQEIRITGKRRSEGEYIWLQEIIQPGGDKTTHMMFRYKRFKYMNDKMTLYDFSLERRKQNG